MDKAGLRKSDHRIFRALGRERESCNCFLALVSISMSAIMMVQYGVSSDWKDSYHSGLIKQSSHHQIDRPERGNVMTLLSPLESASLPRSSAVTSRIR